MPECDLLRKTFNSSCAGGMFSQGLMQKTYKGFPFPSRIEHGCYRGRSIPWARELFILEIANYTPVLKHQCYNLSSFALANSRTMQSMGRVVVKELPAQPNQLYNSCKQMSHNQTKVTGVKKSQNCVILLTYTSMNVSTFLYQERCPALPLSTDLRPINCWKINQIIINQTINVINLIPRLRIY